MSSETYQQWHDGFSGAAELERLRTENEQLREQVHARSDQEAIDMAVSRAVLAERELASLRTENERLKLELEISWDDLPGAIDALDDVIPQGCKQLLRQCAKDLRALRAHTAAAQADSADIARRLMDQATEIIRLSSPPQERAEIAERAIEPLHERNYLQYASDRDALLGDCAAWRNALGVSQDALSERNRECVELRERCGRLEGALKLARKYVGCDRECGSSEYQNGQRVSCGCGFAAALPTIIAAATNSEIVTREDGRRTYLPLAASQQHTAGIQKPFQRRCADWYRECFRREPQVEPATRCHRFIEESLELAQSFGVTEQEALQLLGYVYSRPKGSFTQEVGGVLTTLAILCQVAAVDMDACGEMGLKDAYNRIEKIRAKDAAKPQFSPLPGNSYEQHTPGSGDGVALTAEQGARLFNQPGERNSGGTPE